MAFNDKWTRIRLERRVNWAEGLETFCFSGPIPEFKAGQFLQLGLELPDRDLSRPYSVASAPKQPLEFFVVLVEDGAFTPRLFAMEPGQELFCRVPGAGVFTLDWVRSARTLWLLSTGTGLAPYIAMLRTEEPWERFEHIVVVHGVRYGEHLAYGEELQAMSAAHGGRLSWVPTVTREDHAGSLRGRIPALLDSGAIQERCGRSLDPETSQVLMCGNPAMIKQLEPELAARGMERNRKRSPGHVTIEKYW